MAEKIMVIIPHPDDAEFGCGGTIARKVKEGAQVVYVVCTNGDKGAPDTSITSERLAQIRRGEQNCAAGVLGVQEVVFLNHPDGGLPDTTDFRRELVRLIRRHRPDTVFTVDPYRHYQIHRDHRITGQVALDAVFPYSRDPLHHPELQEEGLEPHKVKEVFLWGTDNADTFVDITETFEVKIEALACHESQMRSRGEQWRKFVTENAAKAGEQAGLPLAEASKRLEFRR